MRRFGILAAAVRATTGRCCIFCTTREVAAIRTASKAVFIFLLVCVIACQQLVNQFAVFFFAHQSAGSAQHMWDFEEIPTETYLFHLLTAADLVSVEVVFCLAGDA